MLRQKLNKKALPIKRIALKPKVTNELEQDIVKALDAHLDFDPERIELIAHIVAFAVRIHLGNKPEDTFNDAADHYYRMCTVKNTAISNLEYELRTKEDKLRNLLKTAEALAHKKGYAEATRKLTVRLEAADTEIFRLLSVNAQILPLASLEPITVAPELAPTIPVEPPPAIKPVRKHRKRIVGPPDPVPVLPTETIS